MSVAETQCANSWDAFDGNTAEEKVMQYLSSERIFVYEIKIREHPLGDNIVVCFACTCGTGRAIYILIEEVDVSQAESLGFTPL